MAQGSRKKVMLALVLTIALGAFLPPNINGTRFSKRLAATLSNALGRQVKIGEVKFRLLPRPGFDLYDFQVLDDPAFNAEPLLLCGEVTADLRLTSLWQGRLEIANLKLQNTGNSNPPSLNLVYHEGHWNLESLLVRAEQVPTAPTAKKRAEQRARFPYIEADAGRINIKSGPEKKPFTLTNTDFSFFLAAEDHWHLRIEGRPVRTDMNLSDTGTIKIEGDLKRAPDLRQTPVKLQLSWQDAQLGQLSSLALGHDKGWRGGLDLNVQLSGSLTDMHVVADAGVAKLRRYDINRGDMLPLNTRCLGEYTQSIFDFNCMLPVQSGAVRLSGRMAASAPADYQLLLSAKRVPLSAVAVFLLHAKRTMPDNLIASGELDADFAFENHVWHGTGTTSPILLRSTAAARPIELSALRFHAGPVADSNPQPVRKRKPNPRPAPEVEPGTLTVDPFTIELGGELPVHAQASLTATSYEIALKGAAALERLLDLGRISGFRSRVTNATGATDFDLTMNGLWANFAPARLAGTAHLHNVTAVFPGIQPRLLLSSDAHFTDAAVVLSNLAARFERTPLELSGSVSAPVNCQSATPCPVQFDLQANTFSSADLVSMTGLDRNNWRLPFISGSSQKFPDVRASGTLSVNALSISRLAMEKFTAHVEIGDHAMLISRINARLADGFTQGDWRVDWSASPVRFSGSGKLAAVAAERLGLPTLAAWISGRTNMNYTVEFSGLSGQEMLSSATAKADFLVPNGVSEVLALGPSTPTRFQNLQGSCELNHQLLNLAGSKFKAENRIYDISGNVSLADRQARLKVSNSATQWEITGALDNPSVAAQRLTAQDAPVHAQ